MITKEDIAKTVDEMIIEYMCPKVCSFWVKKIVPLLNQLKTATRSSEDLRAQTINKINEAQHIIECRKSMFETLCVDLSRVFILLEEIKKEVQG